MWDLSTTEEHNKSGAYTLFGVPFDHADKANKKIKVNHWRILKDAGIERPYHLADVAKYLNMARRTPQYEALRQKVYTPEFQREFIAGLRACNLHGGVYQWHSTVREHCNKCEVK